MSSGESCSYRSFGGGGATGDRRRVGGEATGAPPRPRATGGRRAEVDYFTRRKKLGRAGAPKICIKSCQYFLKSKLPSIHILISYSLFKQYIFLTYH
jgi:hypothetical protein